MTARRPQRRSFWALVALLSLVITATGQTGNMSLVWGGQASLDHDVVIDEEVTLEVTGIPGERFALAACNDHATFNTSLGVVELDMTAPSFSIVIDGFRPGAVNHALGQLELGATSTFSTLPFPSGTPVGTTLFIQGVMSDPTALFGVRLSNAVGVQSIPQRPIVYQVMPRVAFVGNVLQIHGNHFGGASVTGANPTVYLGDVVLPLVSANNILIEATVTPDSKSGYLRILTPGGLSTVTPDGLQQFVMVGGTMVFENGSNAQTLYPHSTVFGAITSAAENDSYFFNANAGDDIEILALAVDPSSLDPVTLNAGQYGLYLDPEVRILLPQVTTDIFAYDDNSGPGFNPAIGVAGAPRFQAPSTGTYTIVIESTFNYSSGAYLLNVKSSAAATLAVPQILGIDPNTVYAGSSIQIIASGLDVSNPAANLVHFPTTTGPVAVVPYIDALGRLTAAVPGNAVTGHIVVENSCGETSTPDADQLESYVLILGITGVVSSPVQNQVVASGQSYIGQITTNFSNDYYQVSLTQGQKLHLRALPYDLTTGRILRGSIFSMNPLDPEISITGITIPGTYLTEVHSGPSFSAEIGGLGRPAWTVPFTGTYSIGIRPWFYLSTGTYILDIRII